MPKKFTGENTKATAARARKTSAKESQQAQKKKEAEDRYWKDDDKHIVRKLQRKEDQEKKKQSIADKKAEIKALLEQESVSVKKCAKAPAPPKITRAQISEHGNVDAKPIKKDKIETHLDVPLEENINRILPTAEEAHTIVDAIALLSTRDEEIEKHPEKRMKAAYTAYEQRQLILLKEKHPTLRLSQLKQMIFKDWQKSPKNPLNQ